MSNNFTKPSIPEKLLSRLGFWKEDMLFWSYYEPRNFGDWIGPYIYHKSTGRLPFHQKPKRGLTTVLSAGSILHWVQAPDSAVVWGSGIISRDTQFQRPYMTHAVRGPLTRQRYIELSYECPEVYGDPGILLPKFFAPEEKEKTHRLGVIPHYAEADLAKAVIKKDPSIRMIDVTRSIEHVVTEICSCEAVISSSLHGIIVSHAYGIPAGWARFSKAHESRLKGDGVKFLDYVLAFGGDRTPGCLALEDSSDFRAPRIESHIHRSELPDIAQTAEKLWNCCPFRQTKP